MQTIEEVWGRIEAWFGRYAPGILSDFQPGATRVELEQAEAVLGVELPEDLKALYRLHNGSKGRFFLGGWSLLSLEWMIASWQLGQDLAGGQDLEVPPAGPLRPGAWHPRWIPFMNDGAGASLCLDLAPGPGGQVGQVIYQDWELGTIGPLAPNLYWYLAFFATELEDGEYHINQFGTLASEDPLSTARITWAPPLPQASPLRQAVLIERVASRAGKSVEETASVVEAIFAVIREALVAGEEVRLVGFGSFYYSVFAAHIAIDPQTGAALHVPARRGVRFASGDDLQRAVAQGGGQ